MRARLPAVGCLTALVVLGACGGSAAPVPGELYGRWDASDERYAGAWIEIGALSVRIGTVEGTVDHNTITGYATEASLEGEVHVVSYETVDGGEGQLAFFHDGETIRLRSRAGVTWKRGSP